MEVPDPIKCGCGALVAVPFEVVEKANRKRKSLPANQYGSAGTVKCPACGSESPIVVMSRLEPPKVRSWAHRRL